MVRLSSPSPVLIPLQAVREYQQSFKAPDIEGLPRFTGGLVGYFSYDTIRYIEPGLGENQHPDPLQTPDVLLMVSDEILIFDKLKGRLFIVINVDPREPVPGSPASSVLMKSLNA